MLLEVIKSIIFDIGLGHYLILAAILFCIGIIGLISSRNIIKILISIEILLNAVNINFIAFANYGDLYFLQGQVFALFVMAIAAAEVALGLAIFISMYRNKQSVDVEDYTTLKG
ncbi:MAG: NADH-quinone oxidoreductase subunit NuoK [Candidatus Gastranaerophilales bacterium]|nr:NADH-quinone oxidoreductase subunit NuoK [Candidatus Gastranaerophilales bacterium]